MNVNLLTGKLGKEASLPIEVKERDFWIQFFQLLNAKGPFNIRPKGIAVLSWIMSQEEPDQCWFYKPGSLLVTQGLRMSSGELAHFLSEFKQLGLVEVYRDDAKIGKKHQNSSRPNQTLLALKKIVREGEININFSFKIG